MPSSFLQRFSVPPCTDKLLGDEKKARRTEQDRLSYNAPILMAHGCPLRHYCCISANSAKRNQKLMTPICAGNIVSKSPSSFSYLRLRHLHLHLPHNLRLPRHLFLPRHLHLHLRLPRPLCLLFIFLANLKRGSAPVRHVTGTGTGLLGEIPRVVVQKSALL